ncbi:MAG: CBS domain-containing protein [Pseudomonadota bacterium]
MTVQRILDSRDEPRPAHVCPDAPISDVLSLLAFRNVGALIVSGDGWGVDGIISERDVVRALQTTGPEILKRDVRDLMTRNVITCVAEDRVAGLMALMVEKHVRHVPVVKNGRFISMVSIRDMLQLRLTEVQSEADAMRNYIAGGIAAGRPTQPAVASARNATV